MTAPTWTPAQAAKHLLDRIGGWFANPDDIRVRSAYIRDWFAAHWPQPQPITGEQLGAALLAEGLNASAGTMAGTINALDRAAARLSPQPVAPAVAPQGTLHHPLGITLSPPQVGSGTLPASDFNMWMVNTRTGTAEALPEPLTSSRPAQPVGVDVEAVAREIADGIKWRGDASHIVAILSRHLTAAPPPAAPVVVPVDGEDVSVVASYFDSHPMGALDYDEDVCSRFAALLNERTQARAADVVPCRVVRRPVETVGMLVVPEDGWYVLRKDGGDYFQQVLVAGTHREAHWTAIRRIDCDEPTTWIERITTSQPRPWRAGDCEAMVGRMVVFLWKCDGIDHGTVLHFATESADSIATMLERGGAHTAYILPAEVPHA